MAIQVVYMVLMVQKSDGCFRLSPTLFAMSYPLPLSVNAVYVPMYAYPSGKFK